MEPGGTIVYRVGPHVFEWHALKAMMNARKHGVSFEEAASAFQDAEGLLVLDEEHSSDEIRWILIASADLSSILFVAHLYRTERIRLISARRATKRERRDYDRARGAGL